MKRFTNGSLRREAGLIGLAFAIVCGVGCAQSRPCMIIPAQLELAKARRDKAKENYEARLEDVTRALNSLEASRVRLENLETERQELLSLLGNGGEQ